ITKKTETGPFVKFSASNESQLRTASQAVSFRIMQIVSFCSGFGTAAKEFVACYGNYFRPVLISFNIHHLLKLPGWKIQNSCSQFFYTHNDSVPNVLNHRTEYS